MQVGNLEVGELEVAPLLQEIAEQAAAADDSRSVSAGVLLAIKASDIMTFTASHELGGRQASFVQIGKELQAVAANCASTAWVLWNHLATFHLFVGLLGPNQSEHLREIVDNHQWVCFPAGASTAIRAGIDGERFQLSGKGAFGSGARYADFAGASFMLDDDAMAIAGIDTKTPHFGLVNLHQPGVQVEADWFSMSLRASATDTVVYTEANLERNRVVDFPLMYREVFREPDYAVINPRYREDWVALSNMWLGLMALGVVQANLDEVCAGIRKRVAIMGVKVAQRPLVQVNLGQAQVNLNAAQDTVVQALAETDKRLANGLIPTEEDYLRQVASAVAALQLCDQAMTLLLRVMGGNGLRQGPNFERRYRDFQAMPLHINAHQDRINEMYGRHLLGLPAENPF